MNDDSSNSAWIADGARTPFLKARGVPGPLSPVDLAVAAGRPLLLRQPQPLRNVDEVVLGCVGTPFEEVNPARVASLRLGFEARVPAWTVQRNCASGMQAVDSARRLIEAGDANVILAGGTDALSRVPLLYNDQATRWFAAIHGAKTLKDKLKAMTSLRPSMMKPEIGLLQALNDPIAGVSMGRTAEIVAHQRGISREDADEFAAQSHQRAADARKEGRPQDLETAISTKGDLLDRDDGIRDDADPEKLAKLKPAFDRPYGKVSAGNSSQVTDGACWTLLASERALESAGNKPLARIVDVAWSGCPPEVMGYGPILAASKLLARNRLNADDVGVWEINEAFAAQVLACLDAFADEDFRRKHLDAPDVGGTIPRERLNVDGGAIAVGHPVGASGTRILLYAARAMKRLNARYAVAAACIGGGMGGAALLENPEA